MAAHLLEVTTARVNLMTVTSVILMSKSNLKQNFEANMLDGDTIQGGQMIASQSVFEYMQEYIDELLDRLLQDGPKDVEVEEPGYTPPEDPLVAADHAFNKANEMWRKLIQGEKES